MCKMCEMYEKNDGTIPRGLMGNDPRDLGSWSTILDTKALSSKAERELCIFSISGPKFMNVGPTEYIEYAYKKL